MRSICNTFKLSFVNQIFFPKQIRMYFGWTVFMIMVNNGMYTYIYIYIRYASPFLILTLLSSCKAVLLNSWGSIYYKYVSCIFNYKTHLQSASRSFNSEQWYKYPFRRCWISRRLIRLFTWNHDICLLGVQAWTYHYSMNTGMQWEMARQWCKQHYTDMVAIQNQEEVNYLNGYLPHHPLYYWIGLRKVADQ